MSAPPAILNEMQKLWCVVVLFMGHGMLLSAQLPPHSGASEKIAGADVVYGSVKVANGDEVRTIITQPKNASGKLPAVMLVGWLSCDSVDWSMGPQFGFAHVLYRVAEKSGFVTVRMEKPGVGESRGPACKDLDFERELAAYRATFQAVRRLPNVDPAKIFILGMSNGGGFAPLVNDKDPVKGYVVTGGWVKTWYEHMLEHERRRLRLMGKNEGEITQSLKGLEEFYRMFLIDGLTPGEVAKKRPDLAPLWYDAPEGQYGRPAAFYQQLQKLNLAAAWEQVNAPVLALHGEYDWIMSADDHALIAAIVNRNHPGTAAYMELPKTTHLLEVLDKQEMEGSGPVNEEAVKQVLEWLKAHAN